MGKWEVTEQAVATMNNMSAQLQELSIKINQETKQLKSSYDDKKDGLGAHSVDIQALLEEVESTEQNASIPIKKLVIKLTKAATIRKNHIENKRYNSGANNSSNNTHLNNQTNVVSTQAEHKTYISDRAGKINAIQEDLKNGSGRNISVMDATKMLESVEEFTGTRSTPIRTAYNNPNAEQHDAEALKALDDYINSAPKWKGTLYRGISVTSEQAEKIISGEDIDMLGPASWSSEKHVAEGFSKGYNDVSIVFTLGENKSGSSITHIGTFDGIESEVTSPSGVKYGIDRIKRETSGYKDTIYIDVHEI